MVFHDPHLVEIDVLCGVNVCACLGDLQIILDNVENDEDTNTASVA